MGRLQQIMSLQVSQNNLLKCAHDMRGECNKILLTEAPPGSERLYWNMSKHMAEFVSTYWDVPYTNITRPSWFIHKLTFPLTCWWGSVKMSFYLPHSHVFLKIMNSFWKHRICKSPSAHSIAWIVCVNWKFPSQAKFGAINGINSQIHDWRKSWPLLTDQMKPIK